MRRYAIFALALTALLSACESSPLPVAPLPDLLRADQDPAPGDRFIVMLADQTADAVGEADRQAAKFGINVDRVFRYALKGYVAEMSDVTAEQLRQEPGVVLVERDAPMYATTIQPNATWGIDRIDQHNLPLSGTYVYNASGAGVSVYVIDTGIRTTHTEFGGRASGVFTSINDGNGTNDCAGHGTHVSGTIGGSTWGVAKDVDLYAVRVLNCSGSGTTSGVIAGVDWVTANAVKPAVANMSLGGGISASLDAAVSNSIASGIVYAVSAGNNGADACGQSPARVGPALTVGATSATDARASFSNFGTCLDLFAPGVSITSSYNSSNTATAILNGTSMASPHVAGVAALYLETQPTASPSAVAQAITSNATAGKVTGAGSGSPNLLLYSGFVGAPPQPGLLLTIYDGNNKTGPVNTGVGLLKVRVTDLNGNPLGGITVTYTVTSGGGVLKRYTDTTGATGISNTFWTLGPVVGTQTVEASIVGAPPVVFTATATAPQTVLLSIASGNNQTGQADQQLPNPAEVLVTDGNANPLSGVQVSFGGATGGGSLNPTVATTGANGRASALWTLGSTVGTQTFEASTAGAAPVMFTATATAPPPPPSLLLTIYDGNNKTGPVNTGVGLLKVRVTDLNGNPLGGITVTYTVTSGGGVLKRYTDTTGATGISNTFWTLGPVVGTQTVEASVSGAAPVTFVATGTGTQTVLLSIASGNNQTGQVNQTLASPAGVLVTDGNGDPLGGVQVDFGGASGGGSVNPGVATTDANGHASTFWTLGSAVGTQNFEASTAGTAPVTFSATATAAPPSLLLAIFDGDNQTGPINTPVGLLKVRVTDLNGDPVGGVTVTYTVKSGGGVLNRYTDTTGPTGISNTRWTLGSTVGSQTVEASINGAPPVTFTATAF